MNLLDNNCRVRTVCACSQRAIWFFVLLLALALGLILGAVFSAAILGALAAIIVFAAVMLAAIIGLLIFGRCRNCWMDDGE